MRGTAKKLASLALLSLALAFAWQALSPTSWARAGRHTKVAVGPAPLLSAMEEQPLFEPAEIVAESPADDSANAADLPSPAQAILGQVLAQTGRAKPPPATRADNSPRQPAPASSYKVRMLVTAYCPCKRCCGQQACGVTASGKRVSTNKSRFVAADEDRLAFGSRVSIPGYHSGVSVPVLDRGGAIKGRRLDVFFPAHVTAKQWGARWLTVTVYRN